MIPTRDEIRTCDNSGFASEKVVKWLHDMRGEIEHLTFKSDKAEGALRGAGWTQSPVSCEWKPPIGPNPSPLLEQIDRLRADLDRANTEAALARDAMAKATTDTRAKVQNELRSVERALCSADVLIKYAAWSRGAYECHVKNTIETAIDALRDDSATTPYSPPFEGDPKDCAFKASDPVREEEIKAWRDWALGDIADPDLYDDCFVLSRAEIDAAVALMRRADGKALLRELRAWIIDEKWCAPGIVRKIDEMLAQPAPVEQPSATPSRFDERASELRAMLSWVEYQPCLRDGITAEVVKQYLGLKIKELEGQPSAPVEQPAAAVPDHFPDAGKMVPDDTRELVAQLADLFKVHLSCNGGVNRQRSDRAAEIAARLRGSK